MPEDETADWARRVLADLDARTPWRSFVPLDGMTAAQAYALQGAVGRLREDRGERVIGYKIGCTSRVIRDQLGIREPIVGRVFDTGVLPTGSRLDRTDYANLAIEGELALRLSRDLAAAPLSDEEYMGAVASVFPVLELHHFVLPHDRPPLAALIASGGMHAGLVPPAQEATCAGRVPLIAALDVTINARLMGSTTEPWTMSGPAATLRWLTARLADWGLSLRRGQVILTGSALPLFPVEPGSRVIAEARPLGMSAIAVD